MKLIVLCLLETYIKILRNMRCDVKYSLNLNLVVKETIVINMKMYLDFQINRISGQSPMARCVPPETALQLFLLLIYPN